MHSFLKYKRNSEYGSESIELVLVVPVLLLLVTVVVQFVLWALAAHAVELAAVDGEHVATDLDSSVFAGKAQAEEVLREVAGSLVLDPQVTVAPEQGGQLSVVVSGRAIALLPYLNLVVESTSTGPIQRFRQSG